MKFRIEPNPAVEDIKMEISLVFREDLCIHSPASLTRKSCSKLAEVPGYFCQQICWLADLMTVTKSAGIDLTHPIFCQQIWWPSLNLLADLPHPISASRFADWVYLMGVTKSASRFTPHFCQQVSWLTDMVTVTICASSHFLPADLLNGRCGDSH